MGEGNFRSAEICLDCRQIYRMHEGHNWNSTGDNCPRCRFEITVPEILERTVIKLFLFQKIKQELGRGEAKPRPALGPEFGLLSCPQVRAHMRSSLSS